MDKPSLVNILLQHIHVKSSITIMDNLFRNSLPNANPRHFQDALPSMEQTEVVPDIKIPRLKDEFQLMSITAHNPLKPLMRNASLLVLVIRGQ